MWIFGLFLILGNLPSVGISSSENQYQFQGNQLVAILAAAILLLVLYFRAKASMIIALHAIAEKKETSFGKAYQVSRFFYAKIFSIYFFLEIGLFLLGLVLITPIGYMFNQHFTNRGTTLLILGLLIFVPVLVVVLLINALAPMFVVIYDLNIRESMTRAFELVSKYWLNLSLLGLLLFLVELPALFLGAIVIGLRGGWLVTIFGILCFLALESIVAVFQQAVWVLAFLDLVKPQKLEETEPVIVPEIIS